MIKVLLVDDHKIIRDGLKALLSTSDDLDIVGECSDGDQVNDYLREHDVDVILMDIGMPRMDGVVATYKVKKVLSRVEIIILTVYEDEPHIFEAIKAGAMGYLLKDVSIDEVVRAIRRVYEGEALIQPVIATKVLKEFAMLDKRKIKPEDKFNGLTEREKEVLRLITLGGTNKEIAQRLGITEKTVKNHISNIFQTLHVNNRTKAALYVLDKMKP